MKSLKEISLKLWKSKLRISSQRQPERIICENKSGVCTDKRILLNDPLAILREDTFSNEEIDEQTGRMIREAYRRQQNE